jgi:hypothetical protein
MARGERKNVDYFPFLCKEGKAMFYIENKYGNDGYATWWKILRAIALADDHYLDLTEEATLMFLAGKCRISEDVLIKIITDLCKLGEFHKQFWEEKKVVWCDKFIENIQDAYKRRNSKCITLIELMLRFNLKCSTEIKKQPEKEYKNTHIILDNIILDNIRGYYFKIQEKIIEQKVSEFLLKNCLIFLDAFDMQNPFPARAEIFIKLDSEYAQHKFDDENHIKNSYKSMKQNWNKKSIEVKEPLTKKTFHEKL